MPRAERLSRSELVAITNSYFDGLSAHKGGLIIAHAGCVRIENGALTTQRPIEGGGLTDCTGEGAMRNIFAVTARRYPAGFPPARLARWPASSYKPTSALNLRSRRVSYSHPLPRAIRAASMRFEAPSFSIASER